MAHCDKLLEKARRSPANLRFDELCQLAECYGFVLDRTKGSHRIYKRPGWKGVLTFQDDKGKAKPYQVRQLLQVIESIADDEKTR